MNNDIQKTLMAGERVTFECKKAQRSFSNSLWDTYSTFANTYRETILLEQPELMQVKLTLHFEKEQVSDPVSDPLNDPVKLTDRQNLILQMFYEDKTLSRGRLCAKTVLSDATAKREIVYLIGW